jgi:hypothetical protein
VCLNPCTLADDGRLTARRGDVRGERNAYIYIYIYVDLCERLIVVGNHCFDRTVGDCCGVLMRFVGDCTSVSTLVFGDFITLLGDLLTATAAAAVVGDDFLADAGDDLRGDFAAATSLLLAGDLSALIDFFVVVVVVVVVVVFVVVVVRGELRLAGDGDLRAIFLAGDALLLVFLGDTRCFFFVGVVVVLLDDFVDFVGLPIDAERFLEFATHTIDSQSLKQNQQQIKKHSLPFANSFALSANRLLYCLLKSSISSTLIGL